MVLCPVLDDGQAQARAAHPAGVALVHPVEPLENPFLLALGDADSRVRNGQDSALPGAADPDGDAAPVLVVPPG